MNAHDGQPLSKQFFRPARFIRRDTFGGRAETDISVGQWRRRQVVVIGEFRRFRHCFAVLQPIQRDGRRCRLGRADERFGR